MEEAAYIWEALDFGQYTVGAAETSAYPLSLVLGYPLGLVLGSYADLDNLGFVVIASYAGIVDQHLGVDTDVALNDRVGFRELQVQ